MAERNVFDLLKDDDVVIEDHSPPKDLRPKDEALAKAVQPSIVAEDRVQESFRTTNYAARTGVSSTKTRKLAPQFTLSKENFGHDRGRQSQVSPDAPKKKVIRFTRDDLLHLRRATKPLVNVLAENPDITSVDALEPESARPIDADEVLRIWSAGESKRDGGRGRGRGRGKGGDDGHYSHGHHHRNEHPLPDDIWDDVEPRGKCNAAAKTLDLAEFSAATLRFSEMGFQASLGDLTMYSEEGDLTMAALLREQDTALLGSLEGDDSTPVAVHKGGPCNEKGRNLLMQTLSVKACDNGSGIVSSQPPLGPSGSAAEVARRAKVQISSDNTLLDSLIDDDAVFGSSSGGAVAERAGEGEALSLDDSALMDDSLLTSAMRAPAVPVAPALSSVSLQQTRHAPAVAPVRVEGWLYLDPQRNVQGPFETSSMRRWLESGYFKDHLPIRLSNWSCFYPLGVVFPNLTVAFLGQTFEPRAPSPSKTQLLAPAPVAVVAHETVPVPAQQRQDSQQVRAQLVEPAPASNRTVFPSGRIQQQQFCTANKPADTTAGTDFAASGSARINRIASDQSPQDSANREAGASQLGSGSKDKSNKDAKTTKQKKVKGEATDAAGNKEANPAPTPSQHLPGAWGQSRGQHKGATDGLSLAEIQQREEAATRKKGTAKSFQLKNLLGVGGGRALSVGSTAGGNAWAAGGTSATTGTQSTASLKDIQQEQQSQSKQMNAQMQQQKGGVNGAGDSQWKTTVGVTADKYLKEERRAPAAQIEAVKASGAFGAPSRPAPGSWAARAGGARALESGVPKDRSRNAPITSPAASIASVTTAPSFATKTSSKAPITVMGLNPDAPPNRKKGSIPNKHREIVEWSVAQVKSLNGEKKSSTEDLALIEFCLTLSSAVDIREYLAHYLGSTPQVSQFATEFIRRTEGKSSAAVTSGGARAGSSGVGLVMS